LVDVLGMAEEHRAFWTEPEGNDIPVLLLEATDKAQHVAGERQQMGPGKACPRARWRRCRDHSQSFLKEAAPWAGGASPGETQHAPPAITDAPSHDRCRTHGEPGAPWVHSVPHVDARGVWTPSVRV